jgi:hypothetical protein
MSNILRFSPDDGSACGTICSKPGPKDSKGSGHKGMNSIVCSNVQGTCDCMATGSCDGHETDPCFSVDCSNTDSTFCSNKMKQACKTAMHPGPKPQPDDRCVLPRYGLDNYCKARKSVCKTKDSPACATNKFQAIQKVCLSLPTQQQQDCLNILQNDADNIWAPHCWADVCHAGNPRPPPRPQPQPQPGPQLKGKQDPCLDVTCSDMKSKQCEMDKVNKACCCEEKDDSDDVNKCISNLKNNKTAWDNDSNKNMMCGLISCGDGEGGGACLPYETAKCLSKNIINNIKKSDYLRCSEKNNLNNSDDPICQQMIDIANQCHQDVSYVMKSGGGNGDGKKDSGLSTGAIIGIIVGSLVFLLLIALLVWYIKSHKKSHMSSSSLPSSSV